MSNPLTGLASVQLCSLCVKRWACGTAQTSVSELVYIRSEVLQCLVIEVAASSTGKIQWLLITITQIYSDKVTLTYLYYYHRM